MQNGNNNYAIIYRVVVVSSLKTHNAGWTPLHIYASISVGVYSRLVNLNGVVLRDTRLSQHCIQLLQVKGMKWIWKNVSRVKARVTSGHRTPSSASSRTPSCGPPSVPPLSPAGSESNPCLWLNRGTEKHRCTLTNNTSIPRRSNRPCLQWSLDCREQGNPW
jgi:hypothetical protein